jgi:hypothetical protein
VENKILLLFPKATKTDYPLDNTARIFTVKSILNNSLDIMNSKIEIIVSVSYNYFIHTEMISALVGEDMQGKVEQLKVGLPRDRVVAVRSPTHSRRLDQCEHTLYRISSAGAMNSRFSITIYS